MIIIDHLPGAPINHCYKEVFSLELHEYTLTIKTNNVSSYWGRCHVAIQWFIKYIYFEVKEEFTL